MSYPGYDLHQQGIGLHNAGRNLEALASYDAALALSPQEAAIHYSRAGVLFMLERMEEALAGYDLCLQLKPDMAVAHYNRANALHRLLRLTEALASLDRALALQPDMAQAWNNRSGVLHALGRLEEALESIGHAARLRPRDDGAFYNAGIMLMALSRYDEAQGAFESALALNPAHPDALGYLGAATLRACNWPKLAQLMPYLVAGIRQGKVAVPPLTLLALSDDPALQQLCAQINTSRTLADTALAKETPPPLWQGERYGHARIRIGYLSTDLRGHPVGAQIVDLLERHDRARFEVIGLFMSRDDGSKTHQRIVKACDQFHHVAEISDREAAALIRELEIDVLVDLNGQTQGWRPAIFKYRPAPVNALFLGYAGTDGADFIDYIIADGQVAPMEAQPFYDEKIVQLPDSFWPSEACGPLPPPPGRAQCGLPDTGFVFCCFNAHHKISVEMFQSWMRLLLAVPGSVLWLREGAPGVMHNLAREARLRGVDPARLVFAPRTPSFDDHLARHAHADLFLDCFPYGAHVTASDALRAGLPVLTRRGRSFVSRVAASFLHALEMDELITDSLKDYEALALALARDPARLGDLRARLAVNRLTKPLFDAQRFARSIEAAYAEMTAIAGRGEKPRAFAVPPPIA